MKKPQSEIIIYQTQNKKSQVEVQLKGETLWLSLQQIADLFDRDKSVISRHLGKIFKEKELDRKTTVANYATGGRCESNYLKKPESNSLPVQNLKEFR
jgi:hypothetical protein